MTLQEGAIRRYAGGGIEGAGRPGGGRVGRPPRPWRARCRSALTNKGRNSGHPPQDRVQSRAPAERRWGASRGHAVPPGLSGSPPDRAKMASRRPIGHQPGSTRHRATSARRRFAKALPRGDAGASAPTPGSRPLARWWYAPLSGARRRARGQRAGRREVEWRFASGPPIRIDHWSERMTDWH